MFCMFDSKHVGYILAMGVLLGNPCSKTLHLDYFKVKKTSHAVANKGSSVLALNEAQTDGAYVKYVKELVLSKHVKHKQL